MCLSGIIQSCGSKQCATFVKEHTCTPVWEEEFTLMVEEDNSELELVVYNFDNGGHQFVGSVLVRLAEMESGEPVDEWYPLTLRELKKNPLSPTFEPKLLYVM